MPSSLANPDAARYPRTHPVRIATERRHDRNDRPCPARTATAPCTCRPDPTDLAELWDGRIRMARARNAAKQALTPTDIEALNRDY